MRDTGQNRQIYDNLFKKILTLSPKAVINFINGLFGTAYPDDSQVTYNWTEFVDDNVLRRRLADTIITINEKDCFHIEAQMKREHTIVLRMYGYGFGQAERTVKEDEDGMVLEFPSPLVLYLDYDGKVPEEYILRLNLDGKQMLYKVPVLSLKNLSIEELNRRKLTILLPFYLLQFRRKMKKERNDSNKMLLRRLLRDDIMGSIDMNYRNGNLTETDAMRLYDYTRQLYNHLYLKYEELEDMDTMTDESFMTPADLVIEKMEKMEETIQKQGDVIQEKDDVIKELQMQLARLRQQMANNYIS